MYSYHQRDPEDPNKTTVRFGFREPRELKCLNRDLSQANGHVTPPPIVEEAEEEVPPMPEPAKPPEPIRPAEPEVVADPKRVLFDALYKLTEEHGIERIEKVLAAVKSLREI